MKASDFYRDTIPLEICEEDFKFQAVEWLDFNESEGQGETSGEEENETPIEKYIIRIFGATASGNSVCVNIKNFTPFFYIKVPDSWKQVNVKSLLSKLSEKKYKNKNGNWAKYGDNLIKSKCTLFRKKDFYGFSNNKLFTFLRLVFDNSETMKKCSNLLKYHNNDTNKISGLPKLPLYESNLDPILRFAHIKNLKFSGWIQIKKEHFKLNESEDSRCQFELNVEWNNVNFYEYEGNARLLQASYDIETYSFDDSFPLPEKKGNSIFQIATTFKFFGDSDFYLKHIICLKNVNNIESEDNVPTIMECYKTEKEVLLAWKKLMNGMSPDILYHYNGDQFDGIYIYKRITEILNCEDIFLNIGKLRNVKAIMDSKNFSSSAYGSTNYNRLKIPGILNFDILTFIKREYKEDSYKLDYIAEKYLGENKNPVTPKMMFQAFRESDPEKLKIVGAYCIQDTLLPQKLVDKLHILQNQITMSNITYVPMTFLIEKGQSIKVFSQVLKETRKADFLVPTIDNYSKDQATDTEEFVGATVLSPKLGAFETPVTVCDFASLYPSIMMAHNLCFSTIVISEEYKNIKEIKYNKFEWEDTKIIKGTGRGKNKTKDQEITTKKSYTFVENVEGILPKLLRELSDSRKRYKKLMKETDDPFLKGIYDKSQLAVKVSMNSVYGFLAAPMLKCKPIAATVTSVGRKMIEDTKNFMEKEYKGSLTVYGDSVTGDTPLLLRNPVTKDIYIDYISVIFNQKLSTDYPEFKALDPDNRSEKEYSITTFEVWTDLGWSKIKKVIRHKCLKKIYKIFTTDSFVKVTQDHSLLDENKVKIKPSDCEIGTKLLTSYPPVLFKKQQDYTIAPVTELMIGNPLAAANYYYQMKQLGLSVEIIDESIGFFNIKTYPQKQFQPNEIKKIVICGPKNGFVYDLETECGRFQAGVGNIICKNTDSCFLQFNTKSTELFQKESERINVKGEITEEDKIYLNKLKSQCIKESIEIGRISADNATKQLFKSPIKLEYEKVYCPLFMFGKKKYTGVLYEDNSEKYKKIDQKGIILVRRDNFKLLQNLYKIIRDILIKKGSYGVKECIEIINNKIDSIKNNEIDLDELIITKTLKSGYKTKDVKDSEIIDNNSYSRDISGKLIYKTDEQGNKILQKDQNLPQLVLTKKIKERNPGSEPKSNDRVSYVFIDLHSNKKEPQYKKVEDPEYVREHNLQLDAEYYINFLSSSVSELLGLYMDNPEQIFKDAIKDYKNHKNSKKN